MICKKFVKPASWTYGSVYFAKVYLFDWIIIIRSRCKQQLRIGSISIVDASSKSVLFPWANYVRDLSYKILYCIKPLVSHVSLENKLTKCRKILKLSFKQSCGQQNFIVQAPKWLLTNMDLSSDFNRSQVITS